METNNRVSKTIEDVVKRAKTLYSSPQQQCRYIQIAIGIIKRDYYDSVRSIELQWEGYNVSVVGFPDGGDPTFWWELYSSSEFMGAGLEKMYDNQNVTSLFNSSVIVQGTLIDKLR